jgi:NADPH:quinone reductase-like Zn-dependent oxidoreductase
VVDEVCDGVDNATVGDEVFGFAVIRRRRRICAAGPLHGQVRRALVGEAAALPAAAETAMRPLDLLGVVADQTVLVNGAAGGVGSAAVQFAPRPRRTGHRHRQRGQS